MEMKQPYIRSRFEFIHLSQTLIYKWTETRLFWMSSAIQNTHYASKMLNQFKLSKFNHSIIWNINADNG